MESRLKHRIFVFSLLVWTVLYVLPVLDKHIRFANNS